MRLLVRSLLSGLAAVLLVACSAPDDSADGDPDSTAGSSPSVAAPQSPDTVFENLMDANAPDWRTEFAVQGATVEDSPTLAIAAAKSSCSALEAQPVEDVLVNLLSGVLPPGTAGTLLYAATVAYCPVFTADVQEYADSNG